MSANYNLLQHCCQPWDCLLHGHLDVIAVCDHVRLAMVHNPVLPTLFRSSNTVSRLFSAVSRLQYLVCLVGQVGIEPTLNRL